MLCYAMIYSHTRTSVASKKKKKKGPKERGKKAPGRVVGKYYENMVKAELGKANACNPEKKEKKYF